MTETRAQRTFFDGGQRLQMTESIELTIQSLQAYGPTHPDWGIAWSGGKDSSATLTMICWLIDTGKIPAPRSLTVFYADTRQELPPLAIAAEQIMDELRERGIRVEVVTAPMDKRFMVYILGRGVPPPNNNTLRWCTRQIKIDPMQDAIEARLDQYEGNVLMITGVRQGESAIRDQRIEMSCGKDGAECGQGWYQQVLPNAKGLRGRLARVRHHENPKVAHSGGLPMSENDNCATPSTPPTAPEAIPDTTNCPDCRGYGRVNDGSGARSPYGPKCPRCGGSGRILAAPEAAIVEKIARRWDGCMAPMFDFFGNPTGPIDIGATIRADAALSAAPDGEARDAARYAWLRRKFAIVGASFHALNLPKPTYVAPDAAVELDAAIDAAMAGGSK